MWSKDTIDWRDKDVNLIIKRATKNPENGDLILMHPKPHTLSALGEIIDFYIGLGFNVVTVGENVSGIE
jgi:peptidoglycan/xylan/chitin deacetylase (PgdA/CDA1 family)